MSKPPYNKSGIAALLGAPNGREPAHINRQEAALLRSHGGLKLADAPDLAAEGRGGDSLIAYLTRAQEDYLREHGGSGTINPETGLHEYGLIDDFFEATVGAAGDLFGGLISEARKITGGGAEFVQDVASKLGQSLEAIVSDPRKLAAMGVMIAFPGAAATVGEFLLPEAAAAALGATGTAIVGQTVINTALNGGDLDTAVKSALIQHGIPAVVNSSALANVNKDLQDVFGKYGKDY